MGEYKDLEYLGYTGTVMYSPKDKMFFGRVRGIEEPICYENTDRYSLRMDFEWRLREYLEKDGMVVS